MKNKFIFIFLLFLWIFTYVIFPIIYYEDSHLFFFDHDNYISIATSFFGVVGFIILIYAVFLQWKDIDIQKNTLLSDFLKEYRSAEFGIALRKLHALKRESEASDASISDTFFRKFEAESESLDISKPEEYKLTIDYSRRIVTQYYHQLSILYEANIIPKKIIFRFWAHSDLTIIPDILKPISEALNYKITNVRTPMDDNSNLVRLYNDAKKHFSKEPSTLCANKRETPTP